MAWSRGAASAVDGASGAGAGELAVGAEAGGGA
jgi:hypothetical protein